MLNLIPEHTKDFEYLYTLVSDRNRWFIKLRYGAVVLVMALFVYIQFFGDAPDTAQNYGILAIALTTLIYNILLQLITSDSQDGRSASAEMPMYIAFAQIVCDLMMLLGLAYLTGLLQSPFSVFFVFHAIIGSMILPGKIVLMIFITLLTFITLLAAAVHAGSIPYYDILGGSGGEIMSFPESIVYIISYWVMLLMSVKFSNSIASAHFRREQELNEALKMIRVAEQEKQKYVMAVVHEIKSPLAAITSYLNILLGGIAGEISEKVRDLLSKSKARADDAIVLTNDILDVSRVKLLEQISFEPVYLEKIIDNVISSIRSKLDLKHMKIELETKSDRCSQFTADRRLIEIVISNLFSNAVKYTPEGGKIKLTLDSRGNEILLKVSDSGIGIPADEQKNLFREFYRASNAKNSGLEGSGLGLAVVEQAVKKHGGNISVDSPGELAENGYPGTTVNIALPVRHGNYHP